VIAEFERRMRIDEKVIKFQTVLLEGGYVAPPPVEAAELTPAEETDESDADDADDAEETKEED
jgi:small subunit ribosomal protein S6